MNATDQAIKDRREAALAARITTGAPVRFDAAERDKQCVEALLECIRRPTPKATPCPS